jgi:dTDP-L-rhamnose 4-epimerase
MNILLTGSAGFVGTHTLRKLNTGEHTIMCLDSMEPQVHPLHDAECWPRVGDTQLALYSGPNVVIHLAAKVGVGQSMSDPVDYVACNSLDTVKFLHNLSKLPKLPKRLVVASSMSVYGEGPRRDDSWGKTEPAPCTETKPPDLRSIYALTKFDQEQLCLLWGNAHGVEIVALRFFNIYGPDQALTNPYTGCLAIFATRLLNGKAPVIYEDGQQSRDFIYVDDVAEAVKHAALDERVTPGIYNVGTGRAITIEYAATTLASMLSVDIKPTITGLKRTGDIRHCYADASKLHATGWKAKVSFEEGMARYAGWLLQQEKPVDKFDTAAKELADAGLVK